MAFFFFRKEKREKRKEKREKRKEKREKRPPCRLREQRPIFVPFDRQVLLWLPFLVTKQKS
jgi:hypothetical protein